MFTPSEYQSNIFEFIRNGTGSAVIEAVAGSGKTTTIQHCIEYIPSNKSILLLAFNKAIKAELETRVHARVSVKTFHALGLQIINSYLCKSTIDNRKIYKVIKNTIVNPVHYDEHHKVVNAIVSKSRAVGIVPDYAMGTGLVNDETKEWMDLISHYGIEVSEVSFDIIIGYVRKVLASSIDLALNNGIIDFDDMIYLPVIMGWEGNKHDYVFVDEAQDVSSIRTAMLNLVLKKEGRVIAVGDSRQAIYGFTGSDAYSMQTLREKYSAVSYPLSVSYRCPNKVVEEAKKIVPSIEPFKDAIEGMVTHHQCVTLEDFSIGDMIICRMNAPLVSLTFRLIANGYRAVMLGRDIGTGLVDLIKKQKATDLSNLAEKLLKYQEKEIAKWTKEDRLDMLDAVSDRLACIRAIQSRETITTVDELIDAIDAIFDKSDNEYTADTNKNVITLCSIHKSKGLESDNVWLLDSSLIPLKSAKKPWEIEQERNLLYVGITRAKKSLNYISSEAIYNRPQRVDIDEVHIDT